MEKDPDGGACLREQLVWCQTAGAVDTHHVVLEVLVVSCLCRGYWRLVIELAAIDQYYRDLEAVGLKETDVK